MNAWVLAARPKTLWAAFAPVLIGSAMAYADHVFHAASAATCLLCAVLIQIATNFWNDYADFKKGADTPDRVGPTRATQAGLITPAAMKRAALITFGLSAVASVYLINRAGVPMLVIGAASIVSGLLYTGGPKPLGYLGLGELFVLVFFGPVAVGGTYFAQALRLPPDVLLAGVAPGLLATAILVVNNLRDLETDAKAGKRTLAVRFGARFARAEYAVCIAGASAIPWILRARDPGHANAVVSSIVLLAAWPALRAVFTETGHALNSVLAFTAILLLLYSILFSVGWLT